MKVLNLWNNEIKDAGAQYLADILRNNKVISLSFTSPTSYLYNHLYSQALTELNLRRNQIGHTGAQSFADALRKNEVIILVLSYVLVSISI